MKTEPLNILMIEDNPDHAELIRRSLMDKRTENQVYHISDGEEALDYLFNRKIYADLKRYPMPNIILLDLRLPKIDGLEVLRTIKANNRLKRIPVVVLTTSNAERDIANAYDLHVNSYLAKPFDFKTFSKLLDDLSYYWQVWNINPKH